MGFVPVALAFITLGAGAALGWGQYAKMKRELPEDDSDIRPEDKLRTKTSIAANKPKKQTAAIRGTPARQPS